MQLELTYPSSPGYKTGGASRQAAKRIAPKAATLRDRVLSMFQAHGPMTADQCAERMGASILSIRPRVTELSKLGKLTKLDRMQPGQFGANQHLYQVR